MKHQIDSLLHWLEKISPTTAPGGRTMFLFECFICVLLLIALVFIVTHDLIFTGIKVLVEEHPSLEHSNSQYYLFVGCVAASFLVVALRELFEKRIAKTLQDERDSPSNHTQRTQRALPEAPIPVNISKEKEQTSSAQNTQTEQSNKQNRRRQDRFID